MHKEVWHKKKRHHDDAAEAGSIDNVTPASDLVAFASFGVGGGCSTLPAGPAISLAK